MIHRAKFQNFKALRDVEVTFDSRLTVLVGPNGSGKTSVLRGIAVLSHLLASGLAGRPKGSLPPNLAAVLSGEAEHGFLVEAAEPRGSGRECGLRILSLPRPDTAFDQHPTVQWVLFCDDYSKTGSLRSLDELRVPGRTPTFYPAEFLQLVPGQLTADTMTTATPPLLESSGQGLASVIAYMKLYDEEGFAAIERNLKEVIPYIRKIRVDRVQMGQVKVDGNHMFGEGLAFDLPNRTGVRAAAMSDGTMLTLGLLTSILGPQRPRVLLLDDIDHGLHPKAQMRLVEVIRKILAQVPDLQIIATTHSLYILHWLKFNEVRLLTLNEDGASTCERLDQHPDYERWKDAMTPGEFWTHVGEDWLLKKQPEPVGAVS